MGAYNLVRVSSLALYRRYRPESFAEVIGQEHVTDPLQQALRNNRVNHAYLFSGPRGCGKTTSARILARCLNCEQGPTPTPCGECQSCRDLARNGPGSIDVIEIDAASHGGVDDARDLREKAFFGPASSRYKIYIIDEAHMVTPAGFNALLKVVEEPPEHLKFIFATTEPEKVIGTIRSRTHHYPFRLVPPGTLREYLGEVCGREGSPVEDGVLPLVVRAGAGSVRDSMSVMDQLLAGAGDDGVTYAMATSLLGYTDGSLLDSVVEAFAAGDGAAAFEVVDRIIEGGNDPRRFVADLLERLRDLVILAAVPDAREKGLIDAPTDVVERMTAQAGVFGAAELSRAADLVNEGLTEMRGATSPRLQLELICARVLLPAAYGDERSLMARLDRIERGVNFTGAAAAGAPAMGYVPGPDAHAGMPTGVPGGGMAASASPAPPVPPSRRVAGPPRPALRYGERGPPVETRVPGRPQPPHQPRSPPRPRPPCRPKPPREPRLLPPRLHPRPPPLPNSRPPRLPRHPSGRRRSRCLARRDRRGQWQATRRVADRHTRGRGTATGRGTWPARAPGRAAPGAGPRACGCIRLPSAQRWPRPPHAVAEHPGGGEEPTPLHLDPAQPERSGDRLRRHDPPDRFRQRGRSGQLREQRQRRGAEAGADRAVQRALEGRGGRRPVRRFGTAARARPRVRLRRWLRGRRRPGSGGAAPRPAAADGSGSPAGLLGTPVPVGARTQRARSPPLRAGTAPHLPRGRHPGGRRSGSRRVRPVGPRTDRERAGSDGGGGVLERVVTSSGE